MIFQQDPLASLFRAVRKVSHSLFFHFVPPVVLISTTPKIADTNKHDLGIQYQPLNGMRSCLILKIGKSQPDYYC